MFKAGLHMHSCGGTKEEKKMFWPRRRLNKVCWREKKKNRRLVCHRDREWGTAAACGVGTARLGVWKTSCQPHCLHASDLQWMEACNFRPVSVHVPSLISTPQYGRRHNTLPIEITSKDLVTNSQACCNDHISERLVGIIQNSCRLFVISNIAKHGLVCTLIIFKTVAQHKICD